jgi:hypothetical protein
MTPVSNATTRVTIETLVAAVVLTAPAAWLGGSRAALGVAVGALLVVLNFRWLAGRAVAAVGAGQLRGSLWLVAAGLRFAVVAAVCAIVFSLRAVDPVGLVVGITVLPVALVAHGLRPLEPTHP